MLKFVPRNENTDKIPQAAERIWVINMSENIGIQNSAFGNMLAKGIRVLTVPPLLVSGMLIILTVSLDHFCDSGTQMILAILLLGILPILAYPLQRLLPTKGEVREEQRNIAFVLTFTGYLTAFIFSMAGTCGRELRYIIVSYFISMLLLVFFNKVLHVRASGHACSVTGTLYFLSFFLGTQAVIPCICIAAAVVWASLRLKRHTVQEIFWGAAVCLPCILASVFIL